MRLVIIPATPLLVRAAAGRVDPVAALRDVVREVLRDAVDHLPGVASGLPPGAAPAADVVVLGTGPTSRAGRLRPTLAAAGVADALLPVAAPRTAGAATRWEGVASPGPSVALLALADAGLDVVVRRVDVVELPTQAAHEEVAGAVRRVRHDATAERLLVVADHPGTGVDAVLATVLGEGRWSREVYEVAPGHEHLPSSYRVTVHRTVGP